MCFVCCYIIPSIKLSASQRIPDLSHRCQAQKRYHYKYVKNSKFLKNPQQRCRICKKKNQLVKYVASDNPQHRIHKHDCSIEKPFVCTKCGKTAISEEALGCHMRAMHRPDLELKKCTEYEDFFNTENALQQHFDK